MDSLSRPVSDDEQAAADRDEKAAIVRYWHQVHMARVVMKAELEARDRARRHNTLWPWA